MKENKMRKNPYNKDLKEQLPLFMQGPSTTTALITNEAQTDILEKSMKIPSHKYEVNGVTFTMVQPPVLNLDFTSNPQDVINVEMGQTEVTQKLFWAVMRFNFSRNKNSPQNPVENVSWFDCISFCNKLSELSGFQSYYKISDIVNDYLYTDRMVLGRVTQDETANGFRLPTEYEWTSFAKAGTKNQWSGTDDEDELRKYAWCFDNSERHTHPVGEKLPNAWGLSDMTGNVDEWCWDAREPNDENIFAQRVVIGGSFGSLARLHTVYDRSGCFYPDTTRDGVGFRICRTIK